MDVFMIAAQFLNQIQGFNVYKRISGSAEPYRISQDPVQFVSPLFPACSSIFSFRDSEGVWGACYYSVSSRWGFSGESNRSLEVEIDVTGPGSVHLAADKYWPNFWSTNPTAIELTATPLNGTPDHYDWSSDGGWFATETTAGPENTFFVDWRDAGDAITVTVEADFDGWIAVDYSGGTGHWTSIASDSNGYPAISCHQYLDGDLKVSRWDGSQWVHSTADADGWVGHWSSIVFGWNDNPMVSYQGQAGLNLAWHNGVDWIISNIDSDGTTGTYADIAVDSEMAPGIVYYADTLGDFRFAKFNGIGWDITTVDSTNNVGTFGGLGFDSADRIYASYLDVTTKDVKLAYFDGEFWELSIIDQVGQYDGWTDVAINSSDDVIVSYFDWEGVDGDLEIAWLY